MLDTFVVKDRFGLDVICKVLGSFEIECFPNKYIAYTDYKYNKDLKYNVYFSELVSEDGENIKIADIEEPEILKTITEMYNEGVGGKND